MNDPKLKQKIAEHIRDSANILVTVSKNPSVDELSAALGLTLLLNKMDKHATAVFSGKTPPAITFLDPEKTFEDTTDSLRDFIIALDKEKADHLRYKLEGDFVKIYITPFRSNITEADLDFSQGDYNVELVIALGVESKDHLDAALAEHGQILDDATVVTLTSGKQTSDLGKIDWHDTNASSLSEMLMSLFETMKLDKKLLNHAIATAWMTGIVAATDRFSNERTTSRAMTLSAQLMSAGADQQLIVSKLSEEREDSDDDFEPSDSGSKTETSKKSSTGKSASKKKSDDGALVISHSKGETLEEVAKSVDKQRSAASAEAAEEALKRHEEQQKSEAEPESEVTEAESAPGKPAEPAPVGAVDYDPDNGISPAKVSAPADAGEPTFGGTLNATSSQAADDKRREAERDANKVILSRNRYVGNDTPTYDSPLNGALEGQRVEQPLDPLGENSQSDSAEFLETPSRLDRSAETTPPKPAPITPTPDPQPAPASEAAPAAPSVEPAPTSPVPPLAQATTGPTLADLDKQHRGTGNSPHGADGDEAARAEIAAVFAGQSPVADTGLPLPPPPPLPPADLTTGLPPLPPIPGQEPERLGDILTQGQPVTNAPLPPEAIAPVVPPPSEPTDPGQFRIPGQ